MGKYRATINMPEAKRYAVAEFPDDDPRVIRMVLDGHLQAVDISDEARKRIDDAGSAPAVSPTSVDAVKRALAEARERAAASGANEESGIQTAVSAEPVDDEPAVKVVHKDAPSKRQAPKARTSQRDGGKNRGGS